MVAGISGREGLAKLIQQEPLIATAPSIEGAANLDVPSSLFFGVGLCNRHSLSQGMPVDTLGMILVSEMLGSEKHIIVADSHAKTNGFEDSDIDRVARQQQETLQRAVENLGLPNWQVMLASEIDRLESYNSILQAIPEENNYLRRELADMEWFRRHKGVGLKVGWVINGSRDSSETFFDAKFREHFHEEMSFLYLEPGKTCDQQKPKSAPYFCGDPSARIIISPEEDVEAKIAQAREKFGGKGVKCCANHMKRLVRLYDRVIGPTERGPVDQKVQQIVDRCSR